MIQISSSIASPRLAVQLVRRKMGTELWGGCGNIMYIYVGMHLWQEPVD
jgi:hypothetical protein